MKVCFLVLAVTLVLACRVAVGSPAAAPLESIPLLGAARDARPSQFDFAVRHGARFAPTPDGRSFYLVWTPPGVASPPYVLTLHGHASYAVDEFGLWYPELVKRGIGIVALQWWFGGGESPDRYYSPDPLYRNIDLILHDVGARPRRVLAHGFSRGAANIYGVTAFDCDSGNHFFALVVANAGKASADFPINVRIGRGEFGPHPFAGTHWVTCAGALDPHPDRDGIQGMRETARWVTSLGGTVDLAIEDPRGDHGAFHRHSENMSAALDVFTRLLKPDGVR